MLGVLTQNYILAAAASTKFMGGGTEHNGEVEDAVSRWHETQVLFQIKPGVHGERIYKVGGVRACNGECTGQVITTYSKHNK